MVGGGAARTRRGRPGKLRRERAVKLAAQALAVGHGDPVGLLAQDPFVVEVEAAVIEEAAALIEAQWQRRFDYLAAKTSGLTSKRLLRGLHKMLGG